MIQWQKVAIGVFVLSSVILAGTTQHYYRQYQELKLNPQKVNQETTEKLVKEVSRLMVLPNETPSIATIKDLEQLKGQLFFVHAKVGDQVLIYPNAKKAILYDPVNKKIVEVAPLNIGGTSDNPPAPTPTPPAPSASPAAPVKK